MKMMTAEQAAKAAKGLTFEKVWAAMMKSEQRMEEYNRKWKERMEESNREWKEQMAESDREWKEQMAESDRKWKEQMKELSKNIGGISNSLGDLTESMFRHELWKKFKEIGIPVTCQSSDKEFSDHDGRILAEVDIFMENGDCVIAVEIKTRLKMEHVDAHLKRIEIIRRYMDERGDKRKLFGAVAGGSVPKKVMGHAQEQGLYVILQNGESVSIADAPQGFKAREW